MTHSVLTSEELREAEQVLDELESHYNVRTEDVLTAAPDNECLAKIDGFDLIEWHFRADQLRVLRLAATRRSYQYKSQQTVDTLSSAEYEYDLVA